MASFSDDDLAVHAAARASRRRLGELGEAWALGYRVGLLGFKRRSGGRQSDFEAAASWERGYQAGCGDRALSAAIISAQDRTRRRA